MKVRSDHELRSEIEVAVTEEMKKLGPTGFSKDAIVKRFLNRGTTRSSIYRWVNAALATGRPGQAASRAIKEAAAIRVARASGSGNDVTREIAAHMPMVVRLEDATGTATVKVIAELGMVITDLEALVAHAKDSDGRIRDPFLILRASDRIRACLETALKIYRATRDVDNVDKLHAAIIEEIAREAPETAERILRRVRTLAAQWAG
jgi:hypothetical protein